MQTNLRTDAITHLRPDLTFFTKHQLRVGTRLRYFGRRKNSFSWYVTKVVSTIGSSSRTYETTFPAKLTDKVTLSCFATGETKTLNFSYLSYSAIWRIED